MMSCINCSMVFSSASTMRTHAMIHHDNYAHSDQNVQAILANIYLHTDPEDWELKLP